MRAQALVAEIALAVCSPAVGQTFVPFVIPAEPNPKSLIALRSGPPISTDGPRLVARGGHFFVGQRRVRIWGVNLCFGACFPAQADAERVAERLAAAGINSVRFHHMDSAAFPRGIWDRGDPKRLSAEALDRLDYFIDRLARRGIYANVNLHVSRTHSRVLKLPDTDRLSNYDKMVDIFTPALVEAQRSYARDLLTHVSKYRKVRYADDPAVAFVEINNEDSLFMWGADRALPALPPYYAEALQAAHIAWLKGRYGGTARLRAAWNEGTEPLGENLLTDERLRQLAEGKGAWRLERHGDCVAKAVKTETGVRIEIAKADAASWHIQLNQSGLAVKAGRYYTVVFRARADQPRRIGYNVGQAHAPWGLLGLSRTADLTPQWQTFRAGFGASADDDNARLNLQLGGSEVAAELADVELRPGGREGLRQGESLEAGKVAVFAETETEARTLDRWRFLAETEKAYFDGMYGFIKAELGCKALVTGTIVFGPLGLYGQSGMDYIDGHAYWQHPRFPGRPWDPGNWTVEQKAMVDHPDESPLFRLAAQRLAGKPYTVSEYNHPAPNDYQAECVPMVASFAAAQDWDGVWLFAYSHRTDDWDREHFSSFFDIQANPAKWGFVPAGTIIFREGGVPQGHPRWVVGLAGGRDGLSDLTRLHLRHGRDLTAAAADCAGSSSRMDWLNRPLAVTLGRAGRPATGGAAEAGRPLKWSGFGGKLGRFEAKGALAQVELGRLPRPDGRVHPQVFVMASLDKRPLDESRRILITACGRCENTDMEFSADRRTVGRDWGGPPVRIEAVTARISLRPDKWRCDALGPDGRAGSQVPIQVQQERDERPPESWVELSPKYETMWYLLMRQ